MLGSGGVCHRRSPPPPLKKSDGLEKKDTHLSTLSTLTPKHPRRRAANTARAGARYRKKQTTVPTAGTTVFRMRSPEAGIFLFFFVAGTKMQEARTGGGAPLWPPQRPVARVRD